jgi:hypothetical protein
MADLLDSRRVSAQQRLADIILQGERDAQEIRRLEAELRQHQVSFVPEGPLDWGPKNAQALRAFLESNHGKVFSERLKAVVNSVAINGARNKTGTIHAAGVSAGWDECARYLFSLSRVSGVQDPGRGGLSPHNDSQPPEDEAALVERLSP